MQLGWIDFSKEDRQKAFDVINLLSEQGAVDELGIGVIRDAFANYFFPGTSTIQTRAKYFLIVPYMLREAVDGRYGKDANRVLRAIDSAEKDCGIRLLEADPKAEGVIGSRVLPKGWVARKPSDIYWNGIRTFVEYIAFVLGDDYVASMLEGKQMGESGFFANSSDAMPALYEKMLKTSVEGPERIKDIGYVLKMVTDKDIIPDEFRELYETFCNTLKIRR